MVVTAFIFFLFILLGYGSPPLYLCLCVCVVGGGHFVVTLGCSLDIDYEHVFFFSLPLHGMGVRFANHYKNRGHFAKSGIIIS